MEIQLDRERNRPQRKRAKMAKSVELKFSFNERNAFLQEIYEF